MGTEGGLQPIGVLAGVVFAMLTCATYSARLSRFWSPDWVRVSCMLCGSRPTPPGDMSAGDAAPQREKIARPGTFDAQYGRRPARSGDEYRAWGVNSFAQLPAFGGEAR